MMRSCAISDSCNLATHLSLRDRAREGDQRRHEAVGEVLSKAIVAHAGRESNAATLAIQRQAELAERLQLRGGLGFLRPCEEDDLGQRAAHLWKRREPLGS